MIPITLLAAATRQRQRERQVGDWEKRPVK
jgi:hypothetical protein